MRRSYVVVWLLMCAVGLNGCSSASSGPAPVFPSPAPPSGVTVAECASSGASATGSAGSVYTVPLGAQGFLAECQVLAAYTAGQIVVAYNDSSVLEGALDIDAFGTSTQSDNAEIPYAVSVPNAPLPEATATPVADVIVNDSVTVYAAYLDSVNRVPVEFSSTAASQADAAALVAGLTPAALTDAARIGAAGAYLSAAPRAPQSSIGAPTYDVRAWAKIGEWSFNHRVDENFYLDKPNGGDKTFLGSDSGYVTLYRLNSNDPGYDYFLADVTYAQGPNVVYCGDAFTCVWFNKAATASVQLSGEPAGVEGTVIEISPVTIVSKTSETLSVGAKLSGKATFSERGPGGEAGGEVSVGWSRTITTESVDTGTPNSSGVGFPTAAWTDKYNHDPPFVFPGTSRYTYTADRLAIFRLPRHLTGVRLTFKYQPEFQGWWVPTQAWYSTVNHQYSWLALLPSFGLRLTTGGYLLNALTIDVKPGATLDFDVLAQTATGQETLKWYASKTPSFVTTNIDPNGQTGNYRVSVHAMPNASIGSIDYLKLNTNPPGGADSVQSGSLSIKVQVANTNSVSTP